MGVHGVTGVTRWRRDFGLSGREVDAHSRLRFQLPDEACWSEQLIAVISVT